ncbi:hypothetical protein Stsp02_23700 [Streptomyces sp. NBRC 14336]|uniref:SRPBCC family protein n=1 Tax=Streptomyces sp. NBRC 14336 TaxID=3030992 RepID=UPI0024A1001F|nr:SRPBCC family protein [Streptomyces sp. NBRC 14336]WBO82009.1 SRPBCC family protein [Streptomyces sp. SBE_14.2]GLW46708.1 hypothetical protein Stsp02_23700 [Streptomyces sp. NBRC 14336]
MELQHEFTVPVPVDDAWRALLDIERIAPCLPGASVTDYDGKTVTGSVRVKVGPVTLTYRGTAVFEERDDTEHRMVLIASGRETRGQGTARATVTGTLTQREKETAVTVRTDLAVTGRPAQFGRGLLSDVGGRLVTQFAECLAERLTEPEQEQEQGHEQERAPEPEPAAPIDLTRTAALPVARRVGPPLVAAVLVLFAWRLRRAVRQRR